MPYIKTIFTEGSILEDFEALLTSNGWTSEEKFKKLAFAYGDMYYGSQNISADPGEFDFTYYIANHLIVSNASGELFGIAQLKKITRKNKQLPSELLETTKKRPNSAAMIADPNLQKKLHEWMMAQDEGEMTDTSEIYFYMLKDMPTITEGKINVYPDGTARGAIDVENLDYTPYTYLNGSITVYSFDSKDAELTLMQSPMMKVKTRETGAVNNGWLTNWWADSKMRVEGLVSPETVSLIIQSDNTAAYDDNNVPTIPIYMGQLIPEDSADTNESVLFGGTAVAQATYNYRSLTPYQATPLLPLKKAYPKSPGNGIDNLIVKRARYGAFYQAYYLSFQTGSDTMPPDRISTDGKSYASSWKNQANDEYLFRFNPSAYDGKVHVSRAYVIHPEEGVRGHLKDMLMASSIGLINSDRLRLKREACPDVFDLYKYFVVDAVSPMTKRPAIPYSPAGFAIFEKEAN